MLSFSSFHLTNYRFAIIIIIGNYRLSIILMQKFKKNLTPECIHPSNSSPCGIILFSPFCVRPFFPCVFIDRVTGLCYTSREGKGAGNGTFVFFIFPASGGYAYARGMRCVWDLVTGKGQCNLTEDLSRTLRPAAPGTGKLRHRGFL